MSMRRPSWIFDQAHQIPLAAISGDRPFRHRTQLRPEALVDSFKRDGQHTAIVVRPHPSRPNLLQPVAGHRRIAAAERLKWSMLLGVVRKDLRHDYDALRESLVDNHGKGKLSTLEKACTILTWRHLGIKESEFFRLLGAVGREEKKLRRLTALPAVLCVALDAGRLKPPHVVGLMEAAYKDPAFDLAGWIRRVEEERLSPRAKRLAFAAAARRAGLRLFLPRETDVAGGHVRLHPLKIWREELTLDSWRSLMRDVDLLAETVRSWEPPDGDAGGDGETEGT